MPMSCSERIRLVAEVFERNNEHRWPEFKREIEGAELPDQVRLVGHEVVEQGFVMAANVLQALKESPDPVVLREYAACIPQEREAIDEWRRRAAGDTKRRLPAPLSRMVALYQEQVEALRALKDVADCLVREADRASASPSPGVIPAAMPERPKNPDHVVLLVHGILSEGEWHERVAMLLRRTHGVEVLPLQYGHVDVLRFLLPWSTRLAPIARLHRKLRSAIAQHPEARISVIAHSFGTYAICRLLSDFSDLKVDRLILCGSVVEPDYPWDRICTQVRHRVVNECGARDIWPRFAASCGWGYGATGSSGFGTPGVRDRFHPGGHHDYFDETFVVGHWIPFVLYGQIPDPPPNQKVPHAPWYYRVLGTLPLRYAIASLILAGGLGVAWAVLSALERLRVT